MKIGTSSINNGADAPESPEPGVHLAIIARIADAGVHEDRNRPGAVQRKVVVYLELVEARKSNGERFCLQKKMNLSLFKSATKCSDFRGMLDTVLADEVAKRMAEGKDVDTDAFVGKTIMVVTEHDARGRAVVKGFARSRSTERVSLENDYSTDFGLHAWLLANQAKKP